MLSSYTCNGRSGSDGSGSVLESLQPTDHHITDNRYYHSPQSEVSEQGKVEDVVVEV
jgi:hypothetical protein